MQKITYFLLGLAALAMPSVVFADVNSVESTGDINLEVPLGTTGSTSGLVDYIATFYIFIVGSIGIVSAVMIMVNGLRWAGAAGNASTISQAKDGVVSALSGLLIALTSFVILNALNPSLVVLQDPTPEELTFGCDADGRVRFLDKLKAEYPDLTDRLQYTGDPEKACSTVDLYEKLVEAMTILEEGTATFIQHDGTEQQYGNMRIITGSVYRSLDTQERLRECYEGFRDTGTCSCGSCNYASPVPDPDKVKLTGHLAGNAIDMGWAGTSWQDITTITGVWHNHCLKDQNFGVNDANGAECTQDHYDSVYAMNSLMTEVGLPNISIEFWHHQAGGGGGPGVYANSP